LLIIYRQTVEDNHMSRNKATLLKATTFAGKAKAKAVGFKAKAKHFGHKAKTKA